MAGFAGSVCSRTAPAKALLSTRWTVRTVAAESGPPVRLPVRLPVASRSPYRAVRVAAVIFASGVRPRRGST